MLSKRCSAAVAYMAPLNVGDAATARELHIILKNIFVTIVLSLTCMLSECWQRQQPESCTYMQATYHQHHACTTQRAPCTVHIAPCTVHRAMLIVHCSPCTVHHVHCSMQHALCTMHHAPCNMHHAQCTMHHDDKLVVMTYMLHAGGLKHHL